MVERTAADPIRVLLLGDYAVGMRLSFARHLADLGVAVTIAHPPSIELTTGHAGVETVTYPLAARTLPRAAMAVRAIRRQRNIEIVHAFSTLPATAASIASWLDPKGRYVRTVNGLGRSFSTTGLRGAVLRSGYTASMILLDQRIRHAVFQNRDDAAWFEHTPLLRRRSHEIIPGSGVDLGQFDRHAVSPERVAAAAQFLGTEGRPTVLLIARHLRSKGVDDLAAMAELAAGLTDRPMLFAVVGPPEPSSRDAATAVDARHGSVEFKRLGAWSDMPALYAASAAVVLPTTYREGIPRVLLEGAAMELPLLAYDVPGCREIVQDGTNGRLIAPGDLRQMATAIVDVLGDDELRARQGAASRSLARSGFEVGIIAGKYVQAYRRIARS